MKLTNLLITVTAISLVFTAMTNARSSDDPVGLKKAREEHHKKAMDEIKPVNDHYRKVLEKKLKSAKKFNKADEMEAIEKELELLKEDSGYLLGEQVEGVAQFEGAWEIVMLDANGNGEIRHTLTITKDGYATSSIGKPFEWGAIGIINLEIKYDSEENEYILQWFDGKSTESLKRSGKRLVVEFWWNGGYGKNDAPYTGKGKRIK